MRSWAPASEPQDSRTAALRQAAETVDQWFADNLPDSTNTGTQFLRSNDVLARTISAAVQPFGEAIVELAGKIVADAAKEVRRQSTSGLFGRLSPKQPTPEELNRALLEATERHLVGEAPSNPLRELVPKDVQAFLRHVHQKAKTWQGKTQSADKFFPSSLFLRCASPAILKAAQTHPEKSIERDLMNRLATLVTKLATQKPDASSMAGADAGYQMRLMTASTRFQEHIRDLEQG